MSNWKELYASKLISVEEAAKKINSGDNCWVSPAAGGPIALLEALSEHKDELVNVELYSAMALYPYAFLMSDEFIGHINFTTVFYGPFGRAFYDEGTVNINSIPFSWVKSVLRDIVKVNTLLADVSTPDEDGYLYYGPMGVSTCYDAAELADKIIVQVNKYQPKVNGIKNKIHVSEVTWICESEMELPELPQPEVTDVDKAIASLIIPRIADGSCIQIGLGGLANAIGYGLEHKKNLSTHTEMFTDSMVFLAKKGVLSGKITAGFGLGSTELYEFCGEGQVQLAPISYVNDPQEIGKNDNLVSINSCLMCDLTGQIGSENLGHNIYSTIGGQLDFAKGVQLSKGGQGFLCLPSTVTKSDGTIASTITLTLPLGSVVTTPRAEVMNIVTEYGIADIYHQSLRERVKRLIAIAHPDFRASLRQEAIDVALIREMDIPAE